jgi:hypothetical protein
LRRSSVAKGDHIKVFRGGYEHHGIDVGDNKVVHFTGEPGRKSMAEVKETTREEFADGGNVEVVASTRGVSADEVANRARQRIGEKDYNLVLNNCEHFAQQCRNGIHKSPQVQEHITAGTARVIVGSALLGMPLAVIAPVTVAATVAVLGAATIGYKAIKNFDKE